MRTFKKVNSCEDFEKLRQNIKSQRASNKPIITFCAGTGCLALEARNVLKEIYDQIKKQGLEEKVDVRETGCLGICEQGPILVVYPEEIPYFKVKAEDIAEIISKTIINGQLVERLLYKDSVTGVIAKKIEDIPFYKPQLRLLLANNFKVNPHNIEDYIEIGGYSALSKTLFQMTPDEVVDEIKKSNIRGRGGAGFPTGIKWETTRKAPGEQKYVIVNCDQGDPGAFMDRALMEGNPHSVLEGLTIGAYAIGASQGFVYVREEYPLAAESISTAIKTAEEYGLLGQNIMGSGFNFTVRVHRGAGAFVSGESSALMTAIEGKVGEPRPKYVHTAVKGIWDRPSCLNNDKTWATIPLIILNGADWFKSIGTKGSSGTMIFSLVGKINNTGLVEVPMGITLRDLIYKIGGGIRGGKKFKAVQTGGPSGGFIPEKYLDLTVDFDELTKVGSMMGSGGMIVMDEDTCMVDAARFFINFLLEESCGKCVPCREGLRTLSSILGRICEGKGKEEDVTAINDILELMRDASLCQLGITAANPVLTSMRYFKEEWDQHINQKFCTAKVCKSLTAYYIEPEKCQGCTLCYKSCPVQAISGEAGIVHVIDQDKCIRCGVCSQECPFDSVAKYSPPTPPSATYGVKVNRLTKK
ncbi:MAG: NADH-quinone oxidoreductase subunit [Thermoproteota archaeon]|nr:NADH-quinone oxidoreductase subunit [Thermoproteota archaeon]